MLEEIRNKCKERYNPNVNTSVDEAMVAFRGRLGFKQYLPLKPTKYGIKVWVRADPTNGYTNEFQVYTGKGDGDGERGLASRVVLDMVQGIFHKNHIVNIDNFFSSPDLFMALLDKMCYARGTVRLNRKHFPKDSLHAKCVKEQGESKAAQKGPLSAIAWKDKRVIHLLSTADSPVVDDTFVERRARDGSRKNVHCPRVVAEYNKYMNGVDRADQIRTEYPSYRNSKKWWHYLFWFLVDLGIANAYIMMKESPNHQRLTKNGKTKVFRQLDFRQNLAKQLIGHCRAERKRKILSSIDPNGLAHMPVKAAKRGRCRHCSLDGRRRESVMSCQACGFSLCLECFEPYHHTITG